MWSRALREPWSRAFVGATLAAACAISAIPVALADDGDTLPAPCTSLGVIGDSLTVNGRLPLLEELAEVDVLDVRVDARISRRTTKDTARIPSGLTALRTMRADGFDPDCFVIALGTNDLWRHTSHFRPMVEQLLAELGDRPRVLWVNVWARPPSLRAASRPFDQMLGEVAASRPGMWVADWAGAVEPHADWLMRDGIHQNDKGRREWARLVAHAVSALLTGGARSAPAPAGCSVSSVPLAAGRRGPDVQCLEQRLHQLRYLRLAPDDRFQSATRTALRRWQLVHGLGATGVLDAATRSALGLAPPG